MINADKLDEMKRAWKLLREDSHHNLIKGDIFNGGPCTIWVQVPDSFFRDVGMLIDSAIGEAKEGV